MNKPSLSKINYTSLLIQLVGVAVIFDLIPMELEQPIIEITLIAGPAIIQIWRTWFTKKEAV
jgi:hypothetical protein